MATRAKEDKPVRMKPTDTQVLEAGKMRNTTQQTKALKSHERPCEATVKMRLYKIFKSNIKTYSYFDLTEINIDKLELLTITPRIMKNALILNLTPESLKG